MQEWRLSINRLRSCRRDDPKSWLTRSQAGLDRNRAHPEAMGFDWKIGTALIGAFAAKEVFVAQMSIVYSVGDADDESDALRDRLRSHYSPLIAFCIMLFCLIGTPCMATIAVTRRESNSSKWALAAIRRADGTLAYLLTVLVFQAGSLFGIGVG